MLPIKLACTILIIIAADSESAPALYADQSANRQIIISAALPKVAFNNPPIESDVRRAISSVA